MRKKGRPALLKGNRENDRVFVTVITAIAIALLTFFLIGSWFRQTYVAYRIFGDSMQATLFEDDWVYGRQGATAERGDIVIIDVKNRTSFADDTIIKRLIAVEGDTVKCEGGTIYLRYAGTEAFVALDEPYAVGSCGDFAACLLQEGEIYVLGDNRGPSRDSSEVGPLRAKEIVAVVPAWSVAHKGAITKWEQFRSDTRDFFYRLFH